MDSLSFVWRYFLVRIRFLFPALLVAALGAWSLAVPHVGNAKPAEAHQLLQTVTSVDLKRYMGTWYEIARLPNRFEKKCKDDVVAHYELDADGKVTVRNQCRLADGGTDIARGRAHVADESSNAKLRVSFFWPFYGDYWIIDLDQDYKYAVVGEPDRKYLWILCRTPQMDAGTYQRLLKSIEEHGYDVRKLLKTEQSAGTAGNNPVK
jgi:apolipoprotein D and lipocalin family protein